MSNNLLQDVYNSNQQQKVNLLEILEMQDKIFNALNRFINSNYYDYFIGSVFGALVAYFIYRGF